LELKANEADSQLQLNFPIYDTFPLFSPRLTGRWITPRIPCLNGFPTFRKIEQVSDIPRLSMIHLLEVFEKRSILKLRHNKTLLR